MISIYRLDSNKIYFHMAEHKSCIGTLCSMLNESKPFLTFSAVFLNMCCNVHSKIGNARFSALVPLLHGVTGDQIQL